MARSGGGVAHDATVANFIAKLWKIVENPENNDLISWTDDGKTVIVKDEVAFSKNILPRYFKHNKFYSFVRQLNLYGFHKTSSPDQGGLIITGNEPSLFWHANFRRGHPEDLHLVQRKAPAKSGSIGEGGVGGSLVRTDSSPQRLSEVMSDIHLMKGRQEGIASVLDALKQDNTHLRHEIGVLKDKHVRQQKVLNKIIHFLVHMVYSKGKIPPTTATRRPKNNRLMLMESEDQLQPPLAKKIRMASTTDDTELDDYDFTYQSNPMLTPDFVTLSPQSIPSVSDHAPTPSMTSPLHPAAPTSNTDMLSPDSEVMQTPPTTSSVSNMELALQPFFSRSVPFASGPVSVTSGPKTTSSGPVFTSSGPLSHESLSSVPISASSGPLSLPSGLMSLASGPGALTSTVLASSNDFSIPTSLLNEFPIPAAPTSLVPSPHPENRMCLNGQLNHQQLGLESLQDIIAGNFNLDPSVITEFMTSSDNSYPDYDYSDTAQILENLPGLSDINIPEESLERFRAALPVMDDGEESAVSSGAGSQDPFLSEDLLQLPVISQP